VTCRKIVEEIESRGFKITYFREDKRYCRINFTHPRIRRIAVEKYGEDIGVYYSTSTAVYNKEKKSLELNLVSPLFKFCELYLDYCCEDNTCICRLHVDNDPPRVGLEVKPLDVEKIGEVLDDFYNCIL